MFVNRKYSNDYYIIKGYPNNKKKIATKKEIKAEKILRTSFTSDMMEIMHHLLVIRKVLLGLETKLARLENANDNLIEAFEQNNHNEGAEQFQEVSATC